MAPVTQLRFTESSGGRRRVSGRAIMGPHLGWRPNHAVLRVVHGNAALRQIDAQMESELFSLGYDDRTIIGSSSPATLTTNTALGTADQLGTSCGYSTGVFPNTQSTCYSCRWGRARISRSHYWSDLVVSASTLNWATFSKDSRFAGPIVRAPAV